MIGGNHSMKTVVEYEIGEKYGNTSCFADNFDEGTSEALVLNFLFSETLVSHHYQEI